MYDTDLSDTEIANERVSISDAARMAGVELPDYEGASSKLWCPFGDLYHSDGGTGKAFRVYPDSNTAYCFACSETYTPVKLIARFKGLAEPEAAEFLLEYTHYVRPDIESRWRAATETVVAADSEYLAEALKIACLRLDPNWEERQFESDISTMFRKCLGLLPKVKTEEEANLWLSTTKNVMQKALGAKS